MCDDKLDSFLDMIEDDPDWSSDDDNDRIFSRMEKQGSTTTQHKPDESKNSLKFEDVFGTPIQTKASTSKKQDIDYSSKCQNRKVPSYNQQLKPSAASSTKPTSDTVIDPYSRISLVKNSVQLYCDDSMNIDAVLKDRNIGIHYVNLVSFSYWYKSSGKDIKKFWTSGVLVKKLAGKKTSQKGNEYTIWEINDLKDLQTSWTVFLFGAAASSDWSNIPIGAYIDVVTPSVLESADSPLKFSISTATQIRHIGTAKYFGYCQSKRKDGQNCTAIVNVIECGVCIHHASRELKKLYGKEKSLAGKKGKSSKSATAKKSVLPSTMLNKNGLLFGVHRSEPQVRRENTNGVITTNYGAFSAPPSKNKKCLARMELQGGSTSMQRNSISQGNHSSISFQQDKKHESLPLPKRTEPKELLKLDPKKTRHLTDKDRQILEGLGASNVESDLPEILALNPNAGARNYLQYLAKKQYQLDVARQNTTKDDEDIKGYGQPIVMNQKALKSMKDALQFVRKNGPIAKVDPNLDSATKKRKLSDGTPSSSTSSPSSSLTSGSASSSSGSGSSLKTKRNSNIEVEFDFESDEFKKILNAKSKHETLLEEIQEEEYFTTLERKEAIENKLLTTFSIPTSAVMCRECKYVALSQSTFCKENFHQIRIVKATKRFFKCKGCGNRAMSLDRLPKNPCSNCKATSWLTAPVGKEKKGPLLASEILSIRGDEEKFLGSNGAKLFLNLSA